MKGFRLFLSLMPAALFMPVCPASAADAAGPYLRIHRNAAKTPIAMETAVVHFTGPNNLSVDLIAAVHVGEKSYYEALNKEFEKYDAVLYELIAPEGHTVPDPHGKKSIVSDFQDSIKRFLALEFQLDNIKYDAKNMVHADLSPDAFMKSLSDRGANIWTLLGKLLLESLNEEQQEDPVQEFKLLMALLTGDSKAKTYQIRTYLAENFGKVDELVAKLEGPVGSSIIEDRNAKCLSVLREQIKSGKKHFAIFYGAAHMTKMSAALDKDFHFVRSEEHWLPAWELSPPEDGPGK